MKSKLLDRCHAAPVFRSEVLALHRAIFRTNKKRIRDSLFDYSASFRRYERTYARGIKRFVRRTTYERLHRAVALCDVVFVGDYHTLPRAQGSFVELCHALPNIRPVVIALEFVDARHQSYIDHFLSNDIDEQTFLDRIGYTEGQGRGFWHSFSKIFTLCKQRGWPVIGIDSGARGAHALHVRDARAARCIVAAMQRQPDAIVMVLVGEMHIAPAHLPRAVRSQATYLGRTPQSLIVYQNCEPIYCSLVARSLEQQVNVVLVKSKQYCLLNTPPIVCQQSFLNTLASAEDGQSIEDPTEAFKNYVDAIAQFFQLPVGNAAEEVELSTARDLSFLQRLSHRKIYTRQELSIIKRQILASESYFLPRANIIYLGNLSVNHISEEATHFIRHVCAQARMPSRLVDAFYARCIEEALGFLGSKIINLRRTRANAANFRQILRQKHVSVQHRDLARLVLMHIRMEAGVRVRRIADVYHCDAHLFDALTHVLGYRLGDRLYDALMHGRMRQEHVRKLFFATFEQEGSALATYLHLMYYARGTTQF